MLLATATGRLLPLVKGSFGSVSAGENHPMCWSNPMQTTGQVECKWVVKSVQLGKMHITGPHPTIQALQALHFFKNDASSFNFFAVFDELHT